MSLLRRKRRQNRLGPLPSPATRDMRLSLEPQNISPYPVRGLRYDEKSLRNLEFAATRSKRFRVVHELPYVFSQEKREKRREEAIRRYDAIREEIYKKHLYWHKEEAFRVSKVFSDKAVLVDLPREHPICRDRERRREVLFALGKSGKSGQEPRGLGIRNDINIRCEK